MTHPSWAHLVPDDEQPWQPLERREVLSHPRPVLVDRVRTHLGEEIDYVYRPRGPRAVFVLPVTPAGEAVLIRQYRYPLGARITEVPAGAVDAGENSLEAARRELYEEVGGQADTWLPLPGFYPQPSFTGVVFHPFLALGVCLGEHARESTELIEPICLPLPEVYRRLAAGEVQDGASALTLFYARPLLEARGLL
ncbi:ADP-ribose pyrophosphatase [Deinobacterium chartae]|uniref:ADP-ribose pyrophosphatase n=1 Tax=Deinobacterium chartae TaxID=521158 RepID=A0A841HZC1_9DEIO|nr:NUDIX hydrolase [Deinobacterium chartae]MBB6098747.1 ADP-ribose pyrophosphatase [Deinobacterium chartae]